VIPSVIIVQAACTKLTRKCLCTESKQEKEHWSLQTCAEDGTVEVQDGPNDCLNYTLLLQW